MKCHHDVEQILSSNTIRNVWKQCAENACWYWGLKGGLTEGGRVEANGKTEENSVYYMAESASVQDEANPAF